MTDHYAEAVASLVEVGDLSDELDQAHRAHADRSRIADLYDRRRVALKVAEIHAQLATTDRPSILADLAGGWYDDAEAVLSVAEAHEPATRVMARRVLTLLELVDTVPAREDLAS